MARANRLVSLAVLMLAAAVAAAGGPEGRRLRGTSGAHGQVAADLQVGPAAVSGQYAGSGACERCHDLEYGAWKRSIHIRMTKPIGEALVAGDFNDVSFADHGRAYRMEIRDGKRFISVSHNGRPYEKFEVHYTLGAKRFQGYLTRLPEGRMYVLPVFWSVLQKRWIDWKEITPVPDGEHDLRQIWNVTCFNCHATNLAQNFDVDTKTYNTTWTEMGLGCEACHGPGKAHVQLMDEWARDPASKPAYDTRASNRQLGSILRIFSPRTSDPRVVYDTCAYCHGNKNNVFLGFTPGQRLEDFATLFLVSQPMPDDDPQGDFWPDGRPSRFNRPQALTLSGCFMKGKATCTNCHVAHGSRQEHSLKVSIADSNRLCLQCHVTVRASGPGLQPAESSNFAATGPDLERHTHHPFQSQGSRCIECHMSDVNWRLLIRRRDHTFSPPVPEMTVKYGVPNACTTCHENRAPEWAIAAMDRWYGDAARRAKAVRVADAFYLAGASDPDALPALATLAVDRENGMLIRASAAEFIGRVYLAITGGSGESLQTGPSQTSMERASKTARTAVGQTQLDSVLKTKVVNALIGAASDPEPTVRIAAVRSLGAIGDERAAMPIVSRLRDDARVVRSSAAEALLWMGITSLPPPAGDVLGRAQDEYAISLTTFPDAVNKQAALGWLESFRGHPAEATRALDTALHLDPQYVRAWVYKGIVFARAGQYADAIKQWETAKKLDPEFPNLDRLIQEAQRRSAVQPR
jgi:predicted CXXCH cytochrome family protein